MNDAARPTELFNRWRAGDEEAAVLADLTETVLDGLPDAQRADAHAFSTLRRHWGSEARNSLP